MDIDSVPVTNQAGEVGLLAAMQKIARSGEIDWPDGDSEQVSYVVRIAREQIKRCAALAIQPATSQETAIPYGSWDTARIKTVIESKLNGVWSWLASIDGSEVDAEEVRSKMDLIDAALKNLADIPDTQPATLQEGEAS